MREEGGQPAGAEERQDGGQDGGGPEGQQGHGGEGQPRPLQAGLGRAAREAVAVAAAEGVVLLPGGRRPRRGTPRPPPPWRPATRLPCACGVDGAADN